MDTKHVLKSKTIATNGVGLLVSLLSLFGITPEFSGNDILCIGTAVNLVLRFITNSAITL